MVAGFRSMMVSANEITTLAAKAARGGGAPPAQAADFGRAALCHLINHRGPAALSDALNALPGGPILSLPLVFAQVIEKAEGEVASAHLPVTADAVLMLSYAESQPFEAVARKEGDKLNLSLTLTTPNKMRPVARVTLPDDLFQHMQTLAAQILVPESDASRLSGAGAGLTDND
ncbi:hypothetical protein [Sulfitobacter sediminilitoris]|nr:hypothetical protein [Sulfitobacter sediminilitoris]